MRFPRTIRFDASDERVFERAAEPGEWAVPGAFAFAAADPAQLTGKARQALANGFLGTATFGRSTFVAVAEITPDQFEAVVQALAAHFVERYGAPDPTAALPAARAEAEFAASLCEGQKVNTLLAVERASGPEGIRERFRVIEPRRERPHARIWALVDESDDP